MSIRRVSILAAAAFAVGGAAAIAQSPAQSSPQAPTESPGLTVVGCVQKESAVLKRTPIAGNMGMDDEFVITFAKPAPAPGAEPKPDAAPPEPTGTSGSASNFGTVYRLTG